MSAGWCGWMGFLLFVLGYNLGKAKVLKDSLERDDREDSASARDIFGMMEEDIERQRRKARRLRRVK